MRLGIVVNQPGLQERRAAELAARLAPDVSAEILAGPHPRHVLSRCRSWDAAYVIDPGRRGLPAALITRGRGKPTIVEIGDPQGELYRAQGRSRAEIRLGELADAAAVRAASGIVFRGADLAATLRPRVDWTYIPDGVDLNTFVAAGGARAREELGLPADELVVGLVGSIQWSETRRSAYGLDAVCALSRLSDVPVRALIVGGGSGLDHLRRRAEELGVAERVRFTGIVAHERVPPLIAAMDVCISTQSNDAIGRGRTTAKLPEYLACDRFVLCTPVGTAARILPSEMLMEHGESGDPTHHERLAVRLRSLYPRRHELRAGAGTRTLAAAHFGYDMIAARLLAFVRTVLPA